MLSRLQGKLAFHSFHLIQIQKGNNRFSYRSVYHMGYDRLICKQKNEQNTIQNTLTLSFFRNGGRKNEIGIDNGMESFSSWKHFIYGCPCKAINLATLFSLIPMKSLCGNRTYFYHVWISSIRKNIQGYAFSKYTRKRYYFQHLFITISY